MIPEMMTVADEKTVLDAAGTRAVNSQAKQPTVSSTWHAVAGRPISDELLDWPADLFALTDVILGRTETYRFVFSPPPVQIGRTSRLPRWPEAVGADGVHGSRIERMCSLSFWPTNGGCRSVVAARILTTCTPTRVTTASAMNLIHYGDRYGLTELNI
jgi:hypothetical protein